MIAVTARTNMDKPNMALAGVDAGAKTFVELKGESGAAAADARKQNNDARILTVLLVAELSPCRIFIQKEPHRRPFVWRCSPANVTTADDSDITPMCCGFC